MTKTDLTIPTVGAPAHATLGASSSARWLTCTPSAVINAAAPRTESPYSLEGTTAHTLASLMLEEHALKDSLRRMSKRVSTTQVELDFLKSDIRGKMAQIVKFKKAIKDGKHGDLAKAWDNGDFDAIVEYVEFVLELARRPRSTLYIEQRVDYSRFAPGGFGTADAVIVSETDRTIYVVDLKFGSGVPVDARDNPQAKLYSLGSALSLIPMADRGKYDTVVWHIHQPRLGYVGTDSMSIRDLFTWAKEVVAPAAALAHEGKGDFVPSDKACQFCSINATCRARVEQKIALAKKEFEMKPGEPVDIATLTPAEIGKLLPLLGDWIKWANSLQAEALIQARDRSVVIPGHKLVRGRSTRKWREGLDPAVELSKIGVDVEDIYAPPEVRSIAQMEKHMGKKSFEEKVAGFTWKPLGTPALVSEFDGREAIDPVAEAAAAFAAKAAAETEASATPAEPDEQWL